MVKEINKRYNLNLTEDKIPLDDKKTWDLISSGKTLGVFQFASPLGISTVRKMHPANIEELAAATSFIRPGSSGLDSYMKGKDDATKVAKTDKRLDKCLKSTYGAKIA
jgi:DNA polymerase-3 subunit alpha